MGRTCPLTTHAADSSLVRDGAAVIRTDVFLRQLRQLAAKLRAGDHLINLCSDRYHFLLGLGAALVSRRVTLMPSSLTPGTLAHVQRDYPGIIGLHDGHTRVSGLPLIHIEELLSGPVADHPAGVPQIPADQVAAVVFTSGSTGEPQPHAKTWGRLCLNAAAEAERLQSQGMHIVATVPSQHMYGFESSILLTLLGGASLWRHRPFYPADICAALQALPPPRMLVTTPFHLATLLDAGLALPRCELLLSATAPLAPELAARAERAFACPLLEIYGSTETSQVASRRTTQDARWQLLRGLRMGADGEGAWVEGGHVEGRVRLADHIGHIDGAFFELGARSADMVNVAGKRASLAALSAQLRGIPGVDDGCFFNPPEPAGGAAGIQRLVALAVAPGMSVAQLMAALRQRVDPAFLPRPLLLVPELPRNATGKLVAADITALYTRLLAP